ncbi:MAG: mechanosensitive ion channel, partial [Cyanobacteriota bacterium]|nr:mechanosensitive ion channel [Cyanobacteriota bacterium]
MSAKNLIIVAITGLLLLAYSFFSTNPGLISNVAVNYLKIAVLICASIATVNILSFLIADVWFARSHGKQPSALLRLVIRIVLYVSCAVVILQLLGKDIAVLFTTSAIVTAVIGFALQSTLGNFFSGVALRIDQPFKIGDRIIIKNVEGIVQSITWRATGIRLSSGMIIYVPNGLMSEDFVTVVPLDKPIKRTIDFLAPAAAPPQKVIDTAYEAVMNQPASNINLKQPVEIRMWQYNLAEPGLHITYKLFYCPKDYNQANRHTDREIMRRIWYALKRQGLSPEYVIPAKNNYLKLIRSIELFQDFSLEAQKIILENAQILIYDTEELLNSNNLPSEAMFIIGKGYVEVEQKVLFESGRTLVKPFSHKPSSQPSVPLNKQIIDKIGYQLVYYIGPSAFSLTQEAAKHTNSIYWLYQLLAKEITDLENRENFLKHCPPSPVELLQKGDFFGERTLFLGEPLPKIKIVAGEETELIAIAEDALAKALNHDHTILQSLSEKFTQHYQEHLKGTIQASEETIEINTVVEK